MPIDDALTVQLASDDDLAIVTTSTGRLIALDLRDGGIRWQHDVGSEITRAHVSGSRVFVGTTQRELIAYRTADGKQAWRRNMGTALLGAPAQAEDLLWVAGLDARLTALKASNGTQMHTIDLSSRNYLDIAAFGQWAVVGARYGPWLAVRAPTSTERSQGNARRPTQPIRVVVQQPPAAGTPDLMIPAGSGPAGVAVVGGDGMVVFLQPQRNR